MRATEGTYCINEDGYALKSNEKLIGGKTGQPVLHKLRMFERENTLLRSLPRKKKMCGPYSARYNGRNSKKKLFS